VLLKVVDLAADAGLDDHAWRLPVVLWTYHNVCGHWHDGARLHRAALESARHRGDQGGQAFALRGLGSFVMSIGTYAEAHRYLSAAQSTFRELGDDLGLARTDVIMGQMFEYEGRYTEALSVISDALLLSSDAPNDPNMALVRASALNGSAWNNVQLGDLSTARAFCLQAIELCRSIGYSPGEAGTWDTLGVVWQRLGDHTQAKACFLNAVTLDREMGNRFDLAMVLLHLGDSCASTGDVGGAGEAWEESLAILQGLHHPTAGKVSGRLATLDQASSSLLYVVFSATQSLPVSSPPTSPGLYLVTI
jgi:tetratricopeptide (TPR) repeat protein